MKLKEVILCTIITCVLVLSGGSAGQARAQTVAAGNSATLRRWDAANEISFTGTIHEVVTQSTSGIPAGVNLTMDGSPSFQYASLGSQLNASIRSELAPGQSVTLKGIVRNVNGASLLFVRELTLGQQTTQLRNIHGLLSPRVEASSYQGNRPRGKNDVAEGAQ